MNLNKTYIENASFVMERISESVGKSDIFVGLLNLSSRSVTIS